MCMGQRVREKVWRERESAHITILLCQQRKEKCVSADVYGTEGARERKNKKSWLFYINNQSNL